VSAYSRASPSTSGTTTSTAPATWDRSTCAATDGRISRGSRAASGGPPRITLVPAGAVSSRGEEAAALAHNAGLELDEAQRQVLHGGLGVRADGTWSAFEVVTVQPRQHGKSATLQARILLGLALGEEIAYTSHRVDSAQEVFRGLVTLAEASSEIAPLLDRVSYSSGKEAIWLTNGGRCVFGTRSSRTGRGFSLDLIVLDEAHYLSEHAHTALMPAASARKRPPQVWYAASSVDEQVHEHGLVLARLHEPGVTGEATNLAYLEWSVDLRDEEGNELRTEQATPEMVDDETLWHRSNPALGTRISVEHVRAERAAMDHRGWLVERLGIGAWPDTSGVAGAPITGEEWTELCDRRRRRSASSCSPSTSAATGTPRSSSAAAAASTTSCTWSSCAPDRGRPGCGSSSST